MKDADAPRDRGLRSRNRERSDVTSPGRRIDESHGSRLGALQGAIAGCVVLPGSPGYEASRIPAVARFRHIRPRAVVRCATPADVAATIAFAHRSGLPTAIRSGGHCFAGHSSTTGIVIDVGSIGTVAVAGGVVTVGAGARLGAVYDTLSAHGRALPAGCGPTVGIAGHALGGGIGILGRKHGLTCDQLLRAEVVLADGRVIACDDDHDADLFWALRGAGGGNFGVVTSLAFRTLPAPAMTGFHLAWPHAAAVAVIAAWQAFAPDAPDELAASLLATVADDIGQIPVMHLHGAMLGGAADTAPLLDRLVALAGTDPATAHFARLSHRETKRYLAELGERIEGASQDGDVYSKSQFFERSLPPGAIEALVANLAAGRRPGQTRTLDFTPMGGAYNRVRVDATAFVHRDARFLLQHTVVVAPDAPIDAREDARRWLVRSWETVCPWGSGGAYQNFADPDLAGWASAYYGANYDRLLRVKARYDPDNVFRFAQSLPGCAAAPPDARHAPPTSHRISRPQSGDDERRNTRRR